MARFISSHKISLTGLLETKVKRNGLSRLYQNLCLGWCFTHNLDCHKGGRIIVAWKYEDLKIDIKRYHNQYIHVEVNPMLVKNSCVLCVLCNGKKAKTKLLNLSDSTTTRERRRLFGNN